MHDISYSAINGQRQEVQNNQAEGVVMLGQMNREIPLNAITKEMIVDYQQQEQELLTAPEVMNGVTMKYKRVDHVLYYGTPPISTKVLVDDMNELIGYQVHVSNDIQN